MNATNITIQKIESSKVAIFTTTIGTILVTSWKTVGASKLEDTLNRATAGK